MADAERFLARWARLKREAAAVQAAVPPAPVAEETSTAEAPPLPSLEELGADSDYGAFLKPEVPRDLHRLALRKAWTSNPTISGFRGLCEYDWDYNAPGYGQLLASDDMLRLCDLVLGPPAALTAGDEPPPAMATPEAATEVAAAGGDPGPSSTVPG